MKFKAALLTILIMFIIFACGYCFYISNILGLWITGIICSGVCCIVVYEKVLDVLKENKAYRKHIEDFLNK